MTPPSSTWPTATAPPPRPNRSSTSSNKALFFCAARGAVTELGAADSMVCRCGHCYCYLCRSTMFRGQNLQMLDLKMPNYTTWKKAIMQILIIFLCKAWTPVHDDEKEKGEGGETQGNKDMGIIDKQGGQVMTSKPTAR